MPEEKFASQAQPPLRLKTKERLATLLEYVLIVEVLPKSTQKYDREGKFDLYKTRPTFREYVLIRQDTCEVETRHREEPDLWRETVVTDPNGSVFLKSLGCSIALTDIYENIEFSKPSLVKK